MPKTFNWIYLGQTGIFMDQDEGDYDAERASLLNNTTWGTTASPLYQRIVPVTVIDNGGVSGLLDTNNKAASDQYSTNIGNGVQTLTHDASAVYTLTLTYADGTTAVTTATVAQSTAGHLFLAPPPSSPNPTLTAKPIAFVQLSGATSNLNVSLIADRLPIGWDNGTIAGTSGNDLINASYVEPVGSGSDVIDGGDGLTGSGTGYDDDVVLAGAGNDTVLSGLGNDTVTGGTGADSILGGAGNDVLYGDDSLGADAPGGNDTIDGGTGNDSILGGFGNDVLAGGQGSDRVDGGAGNDVIGGGTLSGTTFADDNTADTLTGGAGFDRFIPGNGDLISDFGNAPGANINDGNPNNNDRVDLSGHYTPWNLDKINAVRMAAGERPYDTALGWLRADQADGVLNDISTANGFPTNFSLRIQNGGAPVPGSALTEDTVNVVCFADDVLIDTAHGPVAAGDLNVGDLVLTRDHGPQPIRWIGKRHFDAAALEAEPQLRPVRIGRGALGPGRPEADLVLSPQHRILVRSRIAQKMFGTDEVLVAAKQLCQIDGIDLATDLDSVTYVHFLFDDHQIVLSNGAETESLHTGSEAMKSVGPAAREEIFAIFPDLRDGHERPTVRPLASGRMGRKLA
ncbi:Hint domain-containing protein, partial [uncultured Paracoccus sp.]|uniref:Hint domain-containing protein n=1 Tax=uncultured Paracoccus sp. TaxID=189685 RepID=UPI0025FECAD4